MRTVTAQARAKHLASLSPAFFATLTSYASDIHAAPISIGIFQSRQTDWNDWIPAGLSLLGIIVAAVVGYKSWAKQQRWANRERHYSDILSTLTKLKISLQVRASCYLEPGSEHDNTIPKSAHFQGVSRKGNDAYQQLQELVGPASVFLSNEAIVSLEKLIREHWEKGEYSMCTAEFVRESLKLTETTLEVVLAQAKGELMS